ncbi:MAG: arylsulfatase, partial [Anaerohalosphaera sp.]|nr:arylsulfatase [Anaerohalosphaera sp.]
MNDTGLTRRGFLARSGIAAGAFATMRTLPAIADQSRKVNILFIMDDQHRGDCIGADGAKWISTPNLDRLAASGALFTKAYSSVPSCLPARATLLTGQSPWVHGMLGYTAIPARYEHEKPRMFNDAGYRTYVVGKNHFGNHKHGYQNVLLEEAWRLSAGEKFKCDYRKWFEKNYPDKDVDITGLSYTDHRGSHPWPYDESLHPTNWTCDQALQFLKEESNRDGWFVKVSFKRPHPPFDGPKRWFDHYAKVDFPMPKVGTWAVKQHGRIKTTIEKSPSLTRGIAPQEEVRRSRQAYFAGISHVDEQVGRLVDSLKRSGQLENTLILFTSDHGDMMGDNYLWRKCYAYEPSARVPMIVRWPDSLGIKSKRGQKIDKLVELRDVLPTFLDAASIDKPARMDGMSMLDLIRGDHKNWRKLLDLEHSAIYWKGNSWVALTDGRYKYIYFTLN